MNALPLALSLTSTFTKVGAIAGFAALVGIALLSLLAFAQAREIKRLREWAGRAPERAAEMEQRVSTEAAARLQRGGAPAAGAAGAAAPRAPSGARVVPRKTPLVSAPVSTAVNATVAAGKIGAQPDAIAADPAKPALADPALAAQADPGAASRPSAATAAPADPALAAQGNPVATGPAEANPAAAHVAQPSVAHAGGVLAAGTPSDASQPAGSSPQGSPTSAVESHPANGAGAPGTLPVAEEDGASVSSPREDETSATSPATAAARAGVPVPRAPLPPSPSAPMPPGVPASTVAGGAAAASPASSAAASAQAAQPAGTRPTARGAAGTRPTAPAVAARAVASRAVAGPSAPTGAKGAEPRVRKPGAPRARGGDAVSGPAVTRAPGAPVGSGPKYFKQERSAGRTTLLILGGVVIGVAVIVLALSALKGGGKSSPTVSQPSPPSTVAHARAATPATDPSELSVAVVNGTSTNDLAHHLAEDLRQGGYKRAEASSAVPPGTRATTVVAYRTGHRADGQAVAKALDVTRVEPMAGSTESLAGSATVVVVAGADQATQLGGGGGGAQGTGEPSSAPGAGTGSGEGAGAGGATEGAAGSGQ